MIRPQTRPVFVPELAHLAAAPVAIAPAMADYFATLLTADVAQLRAAGPAPKPARRGASPAAVALWGPLFPHANILTEVFGIGTALDQFAAQIRDLAADDSVSEIIISVDSPGGSVFGVEEASQAVYAARKVKPVTAAVDSQAASAAYWIASNASEVVITPGGQAGSVGVFVLHIDQSKAMAMEGLAPTLISAGEKKVAGNSFGPLDQLGRDVLQDSVSGYYDLFLRAVARGRGTTPGAVRNAYGRGGMEIGDRAVASGLADRVLAFDSLLSEKLDQRAAEARAARAAIEARKQSLAADEQFLVAIRSRRAEADTAAEVYKRRRRTAVEKPLKPGPVVPCPTRNAVLWGTALHEAAHGVVAVALNVPFAGLSAVPQPASLGRLEWRADDAHKRSCPEALATLFYAGQFGERLSELPNRKDLSHQQDVETVGRCCPDPVAQRRAYMTASAIIDAHPAAVRLVAAKLLATPARALSSEAVQAYCREAGLPC